MNLFEKLAKNTNLIFFWGGGVGGGGVVILFYKEPKCPNLNKTFDRGVLWEEDK